MNKLTLLVLAAVAAAMPVSGRAADIYIDASSDETIGRRLSYELLERIASSARHNLVNSPDDAAFVLTIVTMDDADSIQTIYSISLTLKNFADPDMLNYFVSSWVGRCGSSVVPSCAANIASEVDAEIEPIARAVTEALKDIEQTPDNETF